ncbi:MAG: hypothetical protein ACI4E1_12090 [Lachnospira sp.]
MNKKHYYFAICILLMFVLSACSLFPNGEMEKVEIDVSVEDGNIKGTLNDKFEIDATLPDYDTSGSFNEYTCITRKINKEISDKYVDKICSKYNKTLKNYEESGGNPAIRLAYYFEDGSKYIDGDYISFMSSDCIDMCYFMFINSYDQGSLKSENSVILDDFSYSDAKERAIDALSIFDGISIDKEPVDSYCLTSEYVNNYYRENNDKAIEEGIKINENKLWTNDDDAYVFYFNQTLNNIPLGNHGFDNNSYFTNENMVTVVVGRTEIEYINFGYLYDITDENKYSNEICSVQEALEELAASYKYTSQINQRYISSVNLVYVPIASSSAKEKEFTVRLYWEFIYETERKSASKDASSYIQKKGFLVDAVNKTTYIFNLS